MFSRIIEGNRSFEKSQQYRTHGVKQTMTELSSQPAFRNAMILALPPT
jgi:hypothetical protein